MRLRGFSAMRLISYLVSGLPGRAGGGFCDADAGDQPKEPDCETTLPKSSGWLNAVYAAAIPP